MPSTVKDHTFLWLLTQNSNRGYDTFDSCIVAADTEEEAKMISPNQLSKHGFGYHSRWAQSPEDVSAEKIGVTKGARRGTVILSSFNAG